MQLLGNRLSSESLTGSWRPIAQEDATFALVGNGINCWDNVSDIVVSLIFRLRWVMEML
jgi:hypothetical protein